MADADVVLMLAGDGAVAFTYA